MIEAKILFTFGVVCLIISAIVLIKCLKSNVLPDYLTKLQEDLKIYVAGEYITPYTNIYKLGHRLYSCRI